MKLMWQQALIIWNLDIRLIRIYLMRKNSESGSSVREEDIRAIVGENDTPLKISVMADVGRTNMKRDIPPKSESVVDMVRVATYINTIPAAIEMANYCSDMGYEVTVNIMAISTAGENELDLALELLASQSKAQYIYLVDSYGSLYRSR